MSVQFTSWVSAIPLSPILVITERSTLLPLVKLSTGYYKKDNSILRKFLTSKLFHQHNLHTCLVLFLSFRVPSWLYHHFSRSAEENRHLDCRWRANKIKIKFPIILVIITSYDPDLKWTNNQKKHIAMNWYFVFC